MTGRDGMSIRVVLDAMQRTLTFINPTRNSLGRSFETGICGSRLHTHARSASQLRSLRKSMSHRVPFGTVLTIALGRLIGKFFRLPIWPSTFGHARDAYLDAPRPRLLRLSAVGWVELFVQNGWLEGKGGRWKSRDATAQCKHLREHLGSPVAAVTAHGGRPCGIRLQKHPERLLGSGAAVAGAHGTGFAIEYKDSFYVEQVSISEIWASDDVARTLSKRYKVPVRSLSEYEIIVSNAEIIEAEEVL